jgi:hypothetical protein
LYLPGRPEKQRVVKIQRLPEERAESGNDREDEQKSGPERKPAKKWIRRFVSGLRNFGRHTGLL